MNASVPFVRTRIATAIALLALAAAAHAATPRGSPAPAPSDLDTVMRDAQEAAREASREYANAIREQTREAVELARGTAEIARMYAQADVDGLMFEPSLAFVAGEFGGAREIVKNAPYQAEAINESIQVLPDGNRIVKRRTTLLARDTYGRTRQERKGDNGSSVYIFDPIDNRSYALNTERKVAVRIPRVPSPPVPPAPPDAIAPPAPVPPVPPVPPAAPTPGMAPPAPPPPPGAATPPAREVTPRVEVSPGRVIVRKGDGRDEDVRIEVVRVGGDSPVAVAPMAPLPPLMLPTLPRGKGETKKLGAREIDGIRAEGTQTTHTIPAGEIGNERPIVITSERWFSPEYNIVVYAKQSDPRTGDTIYRLANFKRGEPPADLFKVPADYKTKVDRR